MPLTFRRRILLTLVPLFALLGCLGGGGVVLLSRLGGRIDNILRENYESSVATERFIQALERIDSSFQFALAGREDKARSQYQESWQRYRTHLERVQKLSTLPGASELVERLAALTDSYQQQGDAFFARSGGPGRSAAYFGMEGQPGLLDTFKEIGKVTEQVLSLDHQDMEQANRNAHETARLSFSWFALGLAAALVLAAALALHTVRAILRPVRALTHSALAIGSGDLDQVAPITSEDELGQLARAFNAMARELRAHRQAQTSQLLRTQQSSQAAIDSFPQPVVIVNCEGRVEMANPAAQQALGLAAGTPLSSAKLDGQLPEALLRPLAEALREHRSHLPKGLDEALSLRCGVQDRFFLPRVLPISDPHGNVLGAAVLLEDVTQFRLLDQLKTDLVATASHELKTPLATIRLTIHWLLEGTLGPLTPNQEEVVLEARDNAERLLATINKLLDLARLEQGRQTLNLRPERVAGLFQAALPGSQSRAAEKGVAVVVDAPTDLPLVARMPRPSAMRWRT